MAGRIFNGSNYRYGFNGKENDNEVKGEGNSLDFGARIYDSRLGIWLAIDQLSKKYPMHSPYNYCAGNPILFVDRDGNDWFVNTKTGQVIFVKDASEVNQKVFDKYKYGGDPNSYTRLGPNDMFGKKVEVAGDNLLKKNFALIENPKIFMENRGYVKAEKVLIKEGEYISGGPMGNEERITQTVTDIKQIGDAQITYVKPESLNKKEITNKTSASGRYSSTRSVTYKLIKPEGQENTVTAEFPGNKTEDLGRDASILDNLIQIGKAIFGGGGSVKKK